MPYGTGANLLDVGYFKMLVRGRSDSFDTVCEHEIHLVAADKETDH